jgi:predicted DNA-binding transcriptional regulator AlpA
VPNRNVSQSSRTAITPARHFASELEGRTEDHALQKPFRSAELQGLFLNEIQVADVLGVSVATVRRWRLLRRGPKFLKVAGTLVRYPVEALNTWLASQPTGGDLVEQPARQVETTTVGGAR